MWVLKKTGILITNKKKEERNLVSENGDMITSGRKKNVSGTCKAEENGNGIQLSSLPPHNNSSKLGLWSWNWILFLIYDSEWMMLLLQLRKSERPLKA